MKSILLFLLCLAGSFFNFIGIRCLELRFARLAIRLRPKS
jgi:hypothetical protein